MIDKGRDGRCRGINIRGRKKRDRDGSGGKKKGRDGKRKKREGKRKKQGTQKGAKRGEKKKEQ